MSEPQGEPLTQETAVEKESTEIEKKPRKKKESVAKEDKEAVIKRKKRTRCQGCNRLTGHKHDGAEKKPNAYSQFVQAKHRELREKGEAVPKGLFKLCGELWKKQKLAV